MATAVNWNRRGGQTTPEGEWTVFKRLPLRRLKSDSRKQGIYVLKK